MLRYRLCAALLLAPVVAFLGVGCGGDKSKEQPQPITKTGEGGAKSGEGGAKAGDRTPLEVKATASLKGRVTFDGDPPPRPEIKIPDDNKDKDYCHKDTDLKDQTWIIGPDKGVADVVVFLRAPEGKFFKVPDSEQKRTDEVVMDQPFCRFIPHVVSLYPSFYDAASKKEKETGQKFVVKNSAEIAHNTAWKGRPLVNDGKNEILKPKVGEMPIPAKSGRPNEAGAEDVININCDIHKWMNARAAVFDHPYSAVTKEDGSYEIKNAPAGAEVVVAYWHESMGPSLKSAKTEKITLKEGDNTKDFKVSGK